MHLHDTIIRPRLAKKIGIQGKEDSLKPLLLTLITEYLRCVEEGSAPAKKAVPAGKSAAVEPSADEATR